MENRLALLGSTGSIGRQALDVARGLGLQVTVLAAHHNVAVLEDQIREWKPELAAVYDAGAAARLRKSIADTNTRVVQGLEGLCEAASYPGAEAVLNAVVGMVGLHPTLAALRAGKLLALANKEALVAGGALVMREAASRGLPVLPVDSEHSAIFQCLQGAPGKDAVEKLILTASGGPFFGRARAELEHVTPEQALRHPNWQMGAKITVDSATMMNKGLELIEASWLFGIPPERIDILVHRESVVHSMVEYRDHSVIAQLGVPDMRLPIQYAFTYPERLPSPVAPLRLTDYGSLTFFAPDEETFACLRACKHAMRRGGLAPAAANGANEAAVSLFLEGKLPFLAIGELVEAAAQRQPAGEGELTVEQILEADRAARAFVREQALTREGCQ